MSVRLIALIFFVFSSLIPGLAFAESRLALVIGNSDYRNIPALANPRNDANRMAEKLDALGFEVVQGTDLDLAGMQRVVREFIRKLDGVDIAVFYYAGHGLQVNQRNFIAPIDARLSSEDDLNFETLPFGFVLSAMERKAQTSLVFLDACRDNPLARNLSGKSGTRSASVGRGLARMGTAVGTFISYSTEPGNVALDGSGGNSPYTTALLEHLGKPGESLAYSMVKVRRQVIKETSGQQVPWEHSSLTGEVVLKDVPKSEAASTPNLVVTAPAPTPTKPLRNEHEFELTFWNSIKDSEDTELYRAYLAKYPDGTFAGIARFKVKSAEAKTNGGQVTVTTQPAVTATNSESAEVKESSQEQGTEVAVATPVEKEKTTAPVEQVKDEETPKVEQEQVRTAALETNQEPTAASEPAVASSEPATEENPEPSRETVRAVQNQLNRLGCNVGRADGLWGAKSESGLSLFRKHSNTAFDGDVPSDALLESLKSVNGRVCPLVCRRGFEIRNGECRRIARQANVTPTVQQPVQRRVSPAPAPAPVIRQPVRQSSKKECYACRSRVGNIRRTMCMSKRQIVHERHEWKCTLIR